MKSPCPSSRYCLMAKQCSRKRYRPKMVARSRAEMRASADSTSLPRAPDGDVSERVPKESEAAASVASAQP